MGNRFTCKDCCQVTICEMFSMIGGYDEDQLTLLNATYYGTTSSPDHSGSMYQFSHEPGDFSVESKRSITNNFEMSASVSGFTNFDRIEMVIGDYGVGVVRYNADHVPYVIVDGETYYYNYREESTIPNDKFTDTLANVASGFLQGGSCAFSIENCENRLTLTTQNRSYSIFLASPPVGLPVLRGYNITGSSISEFGGILYKKEGISNNCIPCEEGNTGCLCTNSVVKTNFTGIATLFEGTIFRQIPDYDLGSAADLALMLTRHAEDAIPKGIIGNLHATQVALTTVDKSESSLYSFFNNFYQTGTSEMTVLRGEKVFPLNPEWDDDPTDGGLVPITWTHDEYKVLVYVIMIVNNGCYTIDYYVTAPVFHIHVEPPLFIGQPSTLELRHSHTVSVLRVRYFNVIEENGFLPEDRNYIRPNYREEIDSNDCETPIAITFDTKSLTGNWEIPPVFPECSFFGLCNGPDCMTRFLSNKKTLAYWPCESMAGIGLSSVSIIPTGWL